MLLRFTDCFISLNKYSINYIENRANFPNNIKLRTLAVIHLRNTSLVTISKQSFQISKVSFSAQCHFQVQSSICGVLYNVVHKHKNIYLYVSYTDENEAKTTVCCLSESKQCLVGILQRNGDQSLNERHSDVIHSRDENWLIYMTIQRASCVRESSLVPFFR